MPTVEIPGPWTPPAPGQRAVAPRPRPADGRQTDTVLTALLLWFGLGTAVTLLLVAFGVFCFWGVRCSMGPPCDPSSDEWLVMAQAAPFLRLPGAGWAVIGLARRRPAAVAAAAGLVVPTSACLLCLVLFLAPHVR